MGVTLGVRGGVGRWGIGVDVVGGWFILVYVHEESEEGAPHADVARVHLANSDGVLTWATFWSVAIRLAEGNSVG